MNEIFEMPEKRSTAPDIVSNDKISIDISHRKLWEEFHFNNNEMILTNKGRCIYPRIGYSIKGLEPKTMYALCLKLCRADRIRYKFTAGEWHMAGSADPENETKNIYSDNGLMQSGQYWMSNGVRFGKLKITNNAKDCTSNVLLTSMHKYRPILFVYKVYASPALRLDGSTIITNQYELVKTYTDPIMEFIAVTAYQNQRIIEMKKMHNSYARGQRGGGAMVRNHGDSPENDSPSTADFPLHHLPISPVNRYQPYLTNGSCCFRHQSHQIPHPIHLPFPVPPTICSPNSSSSSHTSSTNHRSSSGNSNSSFGRSPADFSSNPPPRTTTVLNIQKPAAAMVQPYGIPNSPAFPGLNIPTVWNYSSLWNHFPVPYPSFVPQSSAFLGSNI